jgi:hypothetical protein
MAFAPQNFFLKANKKIIGEFCNQNLCEKMEKKFGSVGEKKWFKAFCQNLGFKGTNPPPF